MIKRLAGITLYLLAAVVVELSLYTMWFGMMWGFNPLMALPLVLPLCVVAAMMAVGGYVLRHP